MAELGVVIRNGEIVTAAGSVGNAVAKSSFVMTKSPADRAVA